MPDRKQNRVRIDAILNAIKKGEYDDKLPEIKSSVEARQEFKRQELLSLVQEVYGQDYTIAPQRPNGMIPRGPRSDIKPHTSPPSDAIGEVGGTVVQDALGEDSDFVPTAPEGPDHRGFESRSPIIGPFNPD